MAPSVIRSAGTRDLKPHCAVDAARPGSVTRAGGPGPAPAGSLGSRRGLRPWAAGPGPGSGPRFPPSLAGRGRPARTRRRRRRPGTEPRLVTQPEAGTVTRDLPGPSGLPPPGAAASRQAQAEPGPPGDSESEFGPGPTESAVTVGSEAAAAS